MRIETRPSGDRRRRCGIRACITLFFLGLFLSAVGYAGMLPLQGRPEEGGKKTGEEKRKSFEKKLDAVLPGGEAQELIKRIREGMKEVDENLLAASARGVRQKMKENARYMEELLDETRAKAGQVIRDLDALIRNVKYRKQQSGNSGQCETPPREGQGEEPRNRPRSEPREEGLKKNPASGKKKKAEEERQKGDGSPADRKPGKDKGTPPPPKPPEKVRRPDVSGRWGVLPPKIQKEILNFNIENFPEKYRKWLEEYYRRVNRRTNR